MLIETTTYLAATLARCFATLALAALLACGCSYRLVNDSRRIHEGALPRAKEPIAPRLVVRSERPVAFEKPGDRKVTETTGGNPPTLRRLVEEAGLATATRELGSDLVLTVRPNSTPGCPRFAPLEPRDNARDTIRGVTLLVTAVPTALFPPIVIFTGPPMGAALILCIPFDFMYLDDEVMEIPFELVITTPAGEVLASRRTVSRIRAEVQGYADSSAWPPEALRLARIEAEKVLVADLVRDEAAQAKVRAWRPPPHAPDEVGVIDRVEKAYSLVTLTAHLHLGAEVKEGQLLEATRGAGERVSMVRVERVLAPGTTFRARPLEGASATVTAACTRGDCLRIVRE